MELTGLFTVEQQIPTSMLDRLGRQHFSSGTTIGELPGYDLFVSPHATTRSVVQYFDENPELPAIIVKNDLTSGILCRKDILQLLSRPYALDLFLSRPLSSILSNLILRKFQLPAETLIEDAIIQALQRPVSDIYEPILVTYKNGQQIILDFHILLMAQTQLLNQANRFIHQQVETGQALSHLMDIHEVLQQIMADLSEMVPYRYGTILLFDHKNNLVYPSVTHTSWPEASAIFDPIYNSRIFNEILVARAPKCIIEPHPDEDGLIFPADLGFSSWLGFPFVYSNHVIGMLSLVRLKDSSAVYNETTCVRQSALHPFGKTDTDLISSLSTTFTAAIRNAQLLSELHMLAETDPLTNTLNRRGFFERAGQRIQEAQNGVPFSILILDIDHFKRINDAYGHQIGDVVIQNVANECQRQMRQTDLLGRYGGEEFVILLPETDTNGARFVAERIRSSIARLENVVGFQVVKVTVSIGGTSFFTVTNSFDRFLQQADEALYQAKSEGRNRFLMWSNELLEADLQEAKNSLNLLSSGPYSDQHSGGSSSDIASLVRKEDLENESVLGLVQALELREKEDRGHAQRVAEVTLNFARLVKIPENELPAIYRGALLHDIGKIAIPDSILFKPGKLTAEEWEIMRKHPAHALQLIASINYLKDAMEIPYCHHEKWNGGGYPRGLAGKEIPLAARLFAIVDVWVALTSDRCYRKAWPARQVIDHIQDQSGRHFDPDLVDLFLTHLTAITGVEPE